jgi:cell division protein ZapA (FtsZ GTPase activity inhibitor)
MYEIEELKFRIKVMTLRYNLDKDERDELRALTNQLNKKMLEIADSTNNQWLKFCYLFETLE